MIVLIPRLMPWNKFVDVEKRDQYISQNDVQFEVVWRYEVTYNSGALESHSHCHEESNFVKCIEAM